MSTVTTPSPRPIRFGAFEIDLKAGELRKGGVRIKLQGQPFEILLMLLERPGELVERERLRERLWPTDTFVDFDHGVNSAINRLREALGDSADSPRFVETVPRRGYRFVAPVEAPAAAVAKTNALVAELSSSAATPAETPQPSPTSSSRKRAIAAAIVIAVVLIVALIFRPVRERIFGRFNPPRIQSLAVLPLTNLSNNAEQDFFADGMTEALTTDLGKISALRVISRTSVMQYKGTKKPLPEIAKELNVDALVEGTVTRSGTHMRITANLVQASPEKHLWAETYESEVGDALVVQGQIAEAVAREVKVSLTKNEQALLAAVHHLNPEAQDLYLTGLFIFDTGQTANSSQRAISYLNQAIEKDSNYAAAYAALARVYANWIPGMTRPRDLMPKAKTYGLKALSLDDTLADAHSALGMIELFYDWDWASAEKEFKRTMELNPNDVLAHEWHARGLVTSGHTDDAIAEAQLALSLDPAPTHWDYPVWVFMLARRYDLANDRAQQMVRLDPDFPWGHFELARIYEQTGKVDEATREFLKVDELFGTDPLKLARLKEAVAKSGLRGYWQQTVEDYRAAGKSGYMPYVLAAEACTRINDKQCAFTWLEKGFEERDDLMINLKVDPILDGLHSDPRFQDLVRRVGIPQ